MKKYILLALFALVTSITFGNTAFKNATFAPWNQQLMVAKVKSVKRVDATGKVVESKGVFTDPVVTSYFGWVVGSPTQNPYQLALQVTFDQSVPVKYYVTFQVGGYWVNWSGGYYKEFTVIVNSQYHTKTQYFTLDVQDRPAPNAWCEVIDYGPY